MDHDDDCTCDATTGELSRRSMLTAAGVVGLSAAATIATPQLAFADGGSGDTLVVVFCRGGLDALSAVVPYTDRDYYRARPGLAIPAGRVVKLDDRFGLHPALAPLRDFYRRGHLAVVHAVGSPANSRSHFDAQAWIERGTPGDKTTPSGWLGRHLQSRPGRSSFRAVSMNGTLQTSLTGPVPAVTLRTVSDFRLAGAESRQAALRFTFDKLFHQLSHPVARQSDAAVEALGRLAKLSKTPYVPRAAYNTSDVGIQLREVARLLRAGIGLEAAAVSMGAWDMHQNHGSWAGGPMVNRLTDLAQSLSAFARDLGPLLNRVTVVVMSEFGRRVAQNGSSGTDHGNGGAMLVLGGGINGGRVYGRWPGLAPSQLNDGDLAVTTDYRSVLGELIAVRCGNPAVGAVFPGATYRPLGLARPR